MSPRFIALLAALMPFLALHLTLAVSAWQEAIPWCVPYLEGCTSISRAGRQENSIFIFRALMLPFALVLMIYWSYAYNWLLAFGDRKSKLPRWMFICGIMGALALAIYVDFLGTHGAAYRLFRRYGIIFFFLLTALAQYLFTYRIVAQKPENAVIRRIGNFKFAICLAQIGLAISQILVELTLEHRYEANNIIEWNCALLLILFSVATYYLWKHTDYRLTTTQLRMGT